jgi:hypothetical protein
VIQFVGSVTRIYDELLLQGLDRWEARDKVHAKVNEILAKWKFGNKPKMDIKS